MRGVLDPATERLPGIDAHNLFTWEVYTRSVFADGHVPFWNPYHFAGTPHLADAQTTVFYPPALLLRWLPVPASLGWMMALHLWIAAAGTLFAARVLGLGWLAASASAVAVGLGAGTAGWIHGGQLLPMHSVAWLPWVLGLVVVSLRSGRLWPDPRLVVVLVLQFLGGHLQGTLYVGAALALYFLYSVVWPANGARWVPLVQLALLAVLCAAAAAFQLLPTLTLVSDAGRSAGLPYDEALRGSWQPRDATTLLYPFYRSPGDPVYRGLGDRLAYAGWVMTLFAPFAFFTRERLRMAIFLGLLFVIPVVLALGDAGGLFRLQHALFPGLRVPGRALFISALALGLAGGLGLESFLSLARERRWRRLLVPAAISCAGVVLATLSALEAPALRAPGWPVMSVALMTGVLIVAVLALLRWPRLALTVALSLVIVDMTALHAGAVSTTPVEKDADVRAWIGPPNGGRALSVCENRVGAREFLQNREPTLDGAAGLNLRDYADWAVLAKSGDIPPGDGTYRRVGSEGEVPVRGDLIDMVNVTRVVACGAGRSQLSVQANSTAWPRAVWVCHMEEVTRSEAIARMVRGRYDASGRLQPRHYITVRWVPTIDDARRAALERTLQLQNGAVVDGVAWRYLVGDASADGVMAIVRHPEVEDTHGVDRSTGVFSPPTDLIRSVPAVPGDASKRTWLPTEQACAQPATVTTRVMDRSDGHVAVRVNAPADGFVFLSEPFYRERLAYIDGREVPALSANLAFTAIAVPAGQHDVELRYSPKRFYAGSAISGLTAVGYLGLVFRRRRKGSPS